MDDISKRIEDHPLNQCLKLVVENPKNEAFRRKLDEEVLAFARRMAPNEDRDELDKFEYVFETLEGLNGKLILKIMSDDSLFNEIDLSDKSFTEMYLKFDCMKKIIAEIRRINGWTK